MLHTLQAIFHAEIRFCFLSAIVMLCYFLMEIFGVIHVKKRLATIGMVLRTVIRIGLFYWLLLVLPLPGIWWNLFLVVITAWSVVVDLALLFTITSLTIVALLARLLAESDGAGSVKGREVKRDLTPEEETELAEIRELAREARRREAQDEATEATGSNKA